MYNDGWGLVYGPAPVLLIMFKDERGRAKIIPACREVGRPLHILLKSQRSGINAIAFSRRLRAIIE